MFNIYIKSSVNNRQYNFKYIFFTKKNENFTPPISQHTPLIKENSSKTTRRKRLFEHIGCKTCRKATRRKVLYYDQKYYTANYRNKFQAIIPGTVVLCAMYSFIKGSFMCSIMADYAENYAILEALARFLKKSALVHNKEFWSSLTKETGNHERKHQLCNCLYA